MRHGYPPVWLSAALLALALMWRMVGAPLTATQFEDMQTPLWQARVLLPTRVGRILRLWMPGAQEAQAQTIREEALGEEWRRGFAAAAGVPVGVYELALAGEMPEIAGIAIHPDFQGKGLGRALLRAVLAGLAGLGCGRCRLLVATDNGRAFSLYRREGFRAAAVKSRWFQMIGTA